MTGAVADFEQRLARIHETGYWRILLHPTEYEEQRIATLKECRDLVEAASVRLRGWDYPHIESRGEGYDPGNGWIQSGSDFGNHIELWRLYQSGQFVHHLATRNDRMPPDWFAEDGRAGGRIRPGPRTLDFVDVLYTMTEILEFTRGLAYRGVLNPGASLTIELHNMTDRMLSSSPDRSLVHPYVYRDKEPIRWKTVQVAPAIVAKAPSLAIDGTVAILERFGWLDVSRSMLEEDQRRFLERRV